MLYYPMLIACEAHPDRERYEQKGHRYRERFLRKYQAHVNNDDYEEEEESHHRHDFNQATCHVQVCRSISDWSHGFLTEHSIQSACTTMSFPWVKSD